MSRLRIIDNLKIVKEIDRSALQAELVCDCKNEYFYLQHTGKQTRGILSSHLIKSKRQLSVVCRCKECGKEIKIYDSTEDGEKQKKVEKMAYSDFSFEGQKLFKIYLCYNYCEENYMTDKFVDCFIYAKDENKRQILLYE